jgi:hypothetical protein
MTKGKQPRKQIRITPALIIGLLMGLGIIFLGIYSALSYGEKGGYFAAGVGVCFLALVLYAAR